jgi:hypothetical protein
MMRKIVESCVKMVPRRNGLAALVVEILVDVH